MMKNRNSLSRVVAYVLTVGGAIGLTASFILTVEKIALLKDPLFQPSCNISPILSCGPVMLTDQAAVFGFANSLLGIIGFSVLITVGVMLLAGASFRRWFWLGLQVASTLGLVFVHYLIFQSLYKLNTLCPYCMVVWLVVIPIFWYVTLFNLKTGFIKLPKSLQKVVDFCLKHHADILIVWLLIIVGLILHRFWYYWSTLI